MRQASDQSSARRRIVRRGLSLLISCALLSCFQPQLRARQNHLTSGQSASLRPDSSSVSQDTKDVRAIEPGKPIERELAADQAHSYQLTLDAGQYLRLVVEQRGIDVVVTLFGPDGQKLTEVDSPNGAQGPEPILLVTKTAGSYRLEVRSLDKDAAAGRYEAKIEVLRSATAQDASRIITHRLFLEGELLRAEATPDSLRRSIQKYEEALSIFRNLGDRKEEASTLNHIGGVYRALNEIQKALDYYNQALSLVRATGDRDEEASSLNHIGAVYNLSGDYQKALDHFTQALPMFQAIGDRVKEARTLRVIGDVYDNVGELQKALDHYNRALPLFQASGDKVREAWTLYSIGFTHRKSRDEQNAIAYFNRALLLYQALGDKSGRFSTLIEIGLSYVGQNENLKALDYFNRALLVREANDRDGEAYVFHSIGTAYRNLGEWQNALEYFNRALLAWRTLGNPSGEHMTLYQIARSERAKGNLPAARSHVEAVLEHIESQRAKISSQELRASYFSAQHEFYEFYISLLMELHKQQPSEGHDAAALQASERARARSLLELLTEAQADIRQGVDPVLLERERSLLQSLNAKAAHQMRLLSGAHTKEQAEDAVKEIESLTNEYRQVQSQIRVKSPRYAALAQPQPLGLKEIQTQVLDSETILLEYALGEERSYLWAVTPDKLTSFELPKRAEIETAVRRIYGLLTARNQRLNGEMGEKRRARVAQADAASPAGAEALSQMLLGPVAQQLGKKRLLIVSDGALQYLPFAALPVPATGKTPVGTQPPLIVEHEIVNLPSASTLAVLRREVEGRRPATKSVAVLADPVFDKDDERVQINIARKGSDRPASLVAQTALSRDVVRAMEDVSGAESLQRLSRLYNTRSEADVIKSLVSPKESMQALDFAANRAAATSPELGQYRIVHFATHAFANNVHPELSGIVLSLVDEKGQPQDGFLRTNEIFNLKLPAELVVLSACRTGLGKEVRGEGLIGLTRGFMYAGTPRVLVSLWSLSDKPTAELMARLYKKMLGAGRLTPAQALRAAQLEMWSDKRWEQPYFWAGFTLQGEWR